jgi:hypothetical protein
MYNNDSSLCYDISNNRTISCNNHTIQSEAKIQALVIVLLCILISIVSITLVSYCLSTKI